MSEALADRFFAAIEAGDLDAADAIYAEDATVWHAGAKRAQTKAENLATLAFLVATLEDRRYAVARRVATPDGFVQEHRLTGTLPDGSSFALDAALFADVAEGRIVRIREYFDSAAAAPIARFAPPKAPRSDHVATDRG